MHEAEIHFVKAAHVAREALEQLADGVEVDALRMHDGRAIDVRARQRQRRLQVPLHGVERVLRRRRLQRLGDDGVQGRACLHDLGFAIALQAVEQAVKGIEGGQRRHEGGVEGVQFAVLRAHVTHFAGHFEQRGRAAQFQRRHVGGKLQMRQFHLRRRELLLQHVMAKGEELAIARLHRAHHLRALVARQQHAGDDGRADDAQAHFGHARDGQREHLHRLLDGGQHDHAGRVAGQHVHIRLRVAVQGRAARAQAHPQGQAGEQQHGLLREQADQGQRGQAAEQGAAQAVKTFFQHHAAAGQGQDDGGGHRRAGRVESQAVGQPQRAERGDEGLADVDPAFAFRRAPVLQRQRQPVGRPAQGAICRCCGWRHR